MRLDQLELINGAFQRILAFAYCSRISENEHLSQQQEHPNLPLSHPGLDFLMPRQEFDMALDKFLSRVFAGAKELLYLLQ